MKMNTLPARFQLLVNGVRRCCLPGILVAGALVVPGLAMAEAENAIPQKPLFLEAGVQPNIFFVLDDSRSMDFEVLRSEAARGIHKNGSTDDESNFTDNAYMNFEPTTEAEKLQLCAGYNVLAYNPELTYTPWKGLDEKGNSLEDQLPTKALLNPYTAEQDLPNDFCKIVDISIPTQPSSKGIETVNGLTCNLGANGDLNYPDGAFYYVWDDKDGDGVYDAEECPMDGKSSADKGSRVYFQDLSAEERTNYANWFSYYRKREFVLKRALSEIIENSQARVGFATINKTKHITNNSDVGTVIKDIDNISLPRSADADKNKTILLDNLLGFGTKGGTHLRQALRRAGTYFQGELESDSLFGFIPTGDGDSAHNYSPILKKDLGGQCQQNFAVVVSDGFWNGDLDKNVGNVDKDEGKSYADGYSDTLADIAMQFYKGDLISELDDVVPEVNGVIPKNTNDNPTDTDLTFVDDNPAQHLVTYTVAFGISGETSCYPPKREESVEGQGWPELCSDPDYSGTGGGWPDPGIGGTLTTVDDMRHAAWNGRGRFLTAKKPGSLVRQLRSALDTIGARATAAATSVAADSTSVKAGEQVVFQSSFNSSNWSGKLAAYDLNQAGTGLGDLIWSTDETLKALSANDRIVITHNGAKGISFKFPVDYLNPADNELSKEQIHDLLFKAPHKSGYPWDDVALSDDDKVTANQTWGSNLAQYFRGDTTNESKQTDDGKPFRPRGGLLGDIIHSAPVLVGAPDPSLYQTDEYPSWAAANKGRDPILYVGANDGALHAFRAKTGTELFVYFPGLIFADGTEAGLHLLADFDYEHRYYVDHTPTVAEVYISTLNDATDKWRSVLVGSLRGGGRGIFALDITDPGDFGTETAAAAQVLWEFSHPDLGYTYSKPTVARLNNGRWAAIFGNGYSAVGEPDLPSDGGTAKLFIHYLDDWDHSEVQILETMMGANTAGTCGELLLDECNGMATPAVLDLDGDGSADRVYVGDRLGNLWVFDLSGSDAVDWRSAYPATGNGDPTPLFTALGKDKQGVLKPQAITSQPAVTLHLTKKSIETEPNLMVFFGTGQFLSKADSVLKEDKSTIPPTPLVTTQSFYGLWDAGAAITDRSELVEQTLVRSIHTVDDNDFEVRTLTNENVDYETMKGWYVDFDDSEDLGERVVSSPLLFGELVVYTTITPRNTQCEGGGTSWLMIHDFFDGSEPNFIALDVDNNGEWDKDDVLNYDETTKEGDNIAGVRTADLFWQPTIVQSGSGAQGKVLLPTDSESSTGELQTQNIQGGRNKVVRSSWTRYDF